MLKGKDNYTISIRTDGTEQMVAYTTLQYFGLFLEIHGFQKNHRGSMLNPKFIKEYCGEECIVTMKNGMLMKVSRRRKDAFLENARVNK